MRKVLALLAGAFALLAGGAFALLWKASSDAIHPPTGEMPWTLADWPGLSAEELQVDGRPARFFPGASRATVVLTHGYGGDQDELLGVADALHRGGLSVFTYNARRDITFGTLERGDLHSVIDHVAALPGVDPERIGALGFSMGGAVTLMAAADDPRIKAVVGDSAWSDVRSGWLRPQLIASPRDRFSTLSLALVEARTATDLDALKPVDVIGQIAPRPLLLVHGEADTVVPVGEAERNFAAAGAPKELWRVPDAAHGDTLLRGGATSSQRVVDFFRQALGTS